MKKCLLCNNDIVKFSMKELIQGEQYICQRCFEKLPICYRHFEILGVKSYVLYFYRDEIKNILLRIKINRDIALCKVLLSPFLNSLNFEYFDYIIVPVPSLESSNEERGFNHVEAIFGLMNNQVKPIFLKTMKWKQSEHNLRERHNIHKVIALASKIDITKKYLIVDDIVSSQESIKACITLLRQEGVKKIKVLVVAYNEFRVTSTNPKIEGESSK